MTHPPCGRASMFLGVAVAVIALFLGPAAGPASAGPGVGARVPPGTSGDPGPEPNKDGEAKKKTGEGAKPGPTARPGKDASKQPHAGKGPPGHGGGHADKTKVKSESDEKDTGGKELTPARGPHQDDSIGTPTADATRTSPLRDPDRDIRALSSGAAGITTDLAGGGPGRAVPAGAAAAAAVPAADAPASPDPVIGGALDPPLLGAGPPLSRWAPFVPALDEPAFPAILLAALAVFLALFGRGDRRDPKLVDAVVDDRTQDVDFS